MNKTLITFFTVLFCLTSSLGWSLEYKDLAKRDGLYYKKFTEVPFNGKVEGQIQGSIRNGKRDGSWVIYHDNGQLSSEGDYKDGKQVGSWIFYHDNGQLQYKGDFNNGKAVGSWVRYHDNGQLWYKNDFKNGKRDDYWVNYYDNGQLSSKGNYKNDKKDGSWILYHDNGKVYSKGDYKDGKQVGSWIKYHKNGKVYTKGNYKNDKKDGSWVSYKSNGNLNFKGNYKNDKEDGSWIFYQDNGKLAAKGNYKNGMVEGYWVFNEFVYGLKGLANPSADQKTGTYKDGKRISDSWSLDYRTISENKDYKIGQCVGLALTAIGKNIWTVKETSKDIKSLLKKNEKRVKKFHPRLKTCKHAFTSGVTEVAVEKMYKCLTKYSSKKDAYFGAGVTESIIISKLPIVNTKAKMSMAIGSFCTIALN